MSIPDVRAGHILRVKSVWVFPAVVGSVLVALMTLIYFGSIVDPSAHLRGLPVLVVNEDQGSVGRQVATALMTTPAVTQRLSVREVTLVGAEGRMDRDDGYATVVIPADFSAATLGLVGAAQAGSKAATLPGIDLLTNVRAGSLGVSLATGVLEPALTDISEDIGSRLEDSAPADLSPVTRAVLQNPVTLTTRSYRPLPSHSGLGLSAFYLALLVTMCGFLGATIINTAVDAALGYATSEVGPWWRQRLPMRISRWHTLVAKWAVTVPVSLLLTGALMLVAVGILGMDAPDLLGLWMYSWYAAAVIAAGTLVLFAALGALGQLVALLLFVYLALASSGGTIPLQALAGFYRFVANFEPLRQILDAVRAILYFGGSGAAGLDRGLILTSVGLVLWLVAGSAVTIWYDRRGFDRMSPELMEYVHSSARAYRTSG